MAVGKNPVYRVHRQMLQRCYLKTATNYAWYGEKGVTVCDRWRFGESGKTGFECFEEDMGERPDGLTLDRKDPFKPYEPANCRWATWTEQRLNMREHYSEAARAAAAIARSERHSGEKSANAKLTNVDVSHIKARRARGERMVDLAREFGVAIQTINGIDKGHKWKSVPAAQEPYGVTA